MKTSPLFPSHQDQGAKFINFAGWNMPFSYGNPKAEHLQVRERAGIFDVSHMGQIRISGPDSLMFLEYLLVSNVTQLSAGQAMYSVLCQHDAGLIDDVILYAFSKTDYFLCVNAGTKDQVLQWILKQKTQQDIQICDESDQWALIAVQGPQAINLCEKIFPKIAFASIPRFHFIQNSNILFSRTGYTGEQGFEIYIPKTQALLIWEKFLNQGKQMSIGPIGLGARDTLRLEMAYLLSGQDFDNSKSPLQVGLSWLLNNPKEHIGRQAILKQKTLATWPKLQAFIIQEPSPVPRKSYALYSDKTCKTQVGTVTSGAKSPSLNKMLALAFVDASYQELYLEHKGLVAKALASKIPFLKKS